MKNPVLAYLPVATQHAHEHTAACTVNISCILSSAASLCFQHQGKCSTIQPSAILGNCSSYNIHRPFQPSQTFSSCSIGSKTSTASSTLCLSWHCRALTAAEPSGLLQFCLWCSVPRYQMIGQHYHLLITVISVSISFSAVCIFSFQYLVHLILSFWELVMF